MLQNNFEPGETDFCNNFETTSKQISAKYKLQFLCDVLNGRFPFILTGNLHQIFLAVTIDHRTDGSLIFS